MSHPAGVMVHDGPEPEPETKTMSVTYGIEAPRHETPGRTIKFADSIYNTAGVAHVRIHYADTELVGIWMKNPIVGRQFFDKLDSLNFVPARVEVRPLPAFDNLSVALRGRQCLYIEAIPREVSYVQ